MSARRISAVVCAALALTFASGSAALAYSTDSAGHSTTDSTCSGPNVIRGTNGDDKGVNALNARDPKYNPSTRYTICGFGGDDEIIANDAGDYIYGGPGNDTITGGALGDYVEGQGGNDTIDGGGGDDNLLGQTGDDTINGGDGADTINGGNGRDKIDGGAGTDNCGPVDPNDIYRLNCP